MKKLILLFTLLTFSFGATAASSVDTSGLSATQKAELKLQIVQLQDNAKFLGGEKVPKAEEVKEWVEIGTAIGEGLAGAAGKLGIEVNKFADTTVGKFTMFVIAWTYLGQEMISILFGMSMMMFGIPVWIWMYRTRGSRRMTAETKWEKGKGPDGKSYHAEFADTSADTKGWYLGVLFLTLFIGTLTVIV